MNIYLKIGGVLTGMMLMLNLSVFAQKGVGDSNGVARSGIQPAIVVLQGSLDHIKTGPCEHTTGHAIIGTHLFINTDESDQVVNIHLGAAYAVEAFVNELESGQTVRFQAFRTEKMEPLEFIAKEVTANEQTLQLRDENLRPVWADDQNSTRKRHYGRHGYRW